MESLALTLNITLIVLLVVAALVVLYVIGLYNDLIFKKNQVEKSFSTIDVILKKRCDLIPNLVATVKNYMQFEQKTLAEVTRLRSRVVSGQVTGNARIEVENQLSRTLGNLFATVENYPELKANENFMHLQETLLELEEQISAARRFYNSSVTDFNNAIEMFPSNLIASRMSLQQKTLFEATEQERRNVSVRQLFDR